MSYPPGPRTHATLNPLGTATPSRFRTAHVRPPLLYRLSHLLNLHRSSLHLSQSGYDSNRDEPMDSNVADGLLVLGDGDLNSIRLKLENILFAANRLRDIQIAQAPDAEPISDTNTSGGSGLIPLNTEVEMIILGIILDTYDLQNLLSVEFGDMNQGAAENRGEGDQRQ
ncbi:hypothetical protein VKT23_012837 [Stygiomarasmius scandens]|uniref:Uncharacterized protein n=1 Tax=Marasmiellus scandens TaxID=2682957 RepID=A0ABR1J4M7_9AGAR